MWKQQVSDLYALKQAIEPFIRCYTIIRQSVYKYDEHGRTNNTQVTEQIRCCIQTSGKNINTDRTGMGRQIMQSFSLYCINPEYVNVGDIIVTDMWGKLKVYQINDFRVYGATSATLVRTGTTQNSFIYDNSPFEPK